MAEVWKDVVGYEGLYQVSNIGNVKSLVGWNGHKYVKREKILKPSMTSTGYRKIELTKERQKKSYKIHRLVAKAFIPEVEGKCVVNHKDGNPLNNNVENLEWCTTKENNNHAITTGLRQILFIPKSELYQMYYIERKTVSEIAEKYSVTHTAVISRMDKYGMKRRTISEAHDKYHIDLNVLLEEMKSGKKNKDLSKKYGCPACLIATRRYQFRKRGILND